MSRDYEVGKDFPRREEVEDFAGRLRHFVITCHSLPLGFTVQAEEEGTNGAGYLFRAYSETSPYAALGRVREKMYHGLSTRHISGVQGDYSMTHDTLRGRITWDSKQGVGLVVDGMPLRLDDLAAILATHEGWGIELRIRDSLE